MIIKRITLTSFAGILDLGIDLSPGLNVIFGENEAGKSTIFNAISHGLFTPSKLTKARFRKEMAGHLPVGGGDTVKVALNFAAAGGDYSLSKCWGAIASSQLTLPNGSLVTEEASIGERIDSLLPASVAVMKAVLLTYQSGMERILDDIQTSGDALFDIREVLREAFQGADGIHADKFKADLEKKIEAYYGRWDRVAGGPEQGRGFKNPWQLGRGKILEDYYLVEKLQSNLHQIRAAEDTLAVLAGKLEGSLDEYNRISAFLKTNEKTASFAPVRMQKLHELEHARASESLHAAAYDEWPRAEARYGEIERLLKEKRKALDALMKEREKAREHARKRERHQEVSSKLKIAGECKEKAYAARAKMESEQALSDEAYATLKTLKKSAEDIERQLHSGSLSVTIKAKKKVQLNIRKGFGEPALEVLEEGGRISFSAEQPLSVDHPDMTLTASSGRLDFEKLEAEHRSAKQELSHTLASYGLVSMAEADERNKIYTDLLKEAEVAKSMLEAALAGESLAALEGELQAHAAEKAVRPIEEIQSELTTTEHEIRSLEEERANLERRLKEYRAEYKTRDAVLDLLVSDRESKKVLQEQIENGPGLPKGFDEWPAFIEACNAYRTRRDELSERILKLKGEKAELLARMPDDSAEETALRLEQAKARLHSTMKTAAALDRILSKTNELLRTPEIELSAGLQREFEERVYKITGGRYRTSRFTDDLPDGLLRKDGAPLSFEQLSSGTRDGFSLALRLAVAHYFLQESDGFIMMDDPLVDMDDNRRRAAASVLEGFAARFQTIVFTCHRAHAELFDTNNLITLDG